MWFDKRFIKKSKYGNQKIETPSGAFDSRLEHEHFLRLQTLEKAGKIAYLQRQVRIKLGDSKDCKVVYIADFTYFDNDLGEFVVFDTKGFETKEFTLKRKWLLDSYIGFTFRVAFKQKIVDYKPFESPHAKDLLKALEKNQ